MKATLITCGTLSLLFYASAATATTITPTDAANHLGQTVTVEGTASVFTSRDGTTFVDLGGSGRSSPFTGVIFEDRAKLFPGISAFNGKTVDIRGQVREYRGKPEIIIDGPDQISSK